MKLYDYYRSSCCYRVRIALNLKGIDYEKIQVHLVNQGGEQHHEAYQQINPQQLVPALATNEQILTQSLAIIEYLDEINPHPALLPAQPLERAHVRALAFIIACDIHPLNNLRVLQALKRNYQATEDQLTQWYHQWLTEGFDAFEARLSTLPRSQPICYGDQISLADICLIPQVYNAQRFHFSLTKYPLIQNINDYCLSLPEFIPPKHDELRDG